jgi:hypothetical protein
MRKWLVTLLLCVVVADALVEYVVVTWPPPPTSIRVPKVGIFYYESFIMYGTTQIYQYHGNTQKLLINQY